MTRDEMTEWVAKCPPEVMKEISRMCLQTATEGIAKMLRGQAGDPVTRAMPGPAALEAAADAIMKTNAKVWGGRA